MSATDPTNTSVPVSNVPDQTVILATQIRNYINAQKPRSSQKTQRIFQAYNFYRLHYSFRESVSQRPRAARSQSTPQGTQAQTTPQAISFPPNWTTSIDVFVEQARAFVLDVNALAHGVTPRSPQDTRQFTWGEVFAQAESKRKAKQPAAQVTEEPPTPAEQISEEQIPPVTLDQSGLHHLPPTPQRKIGTLSSPGKPRALRAPLSTPFPRTPEVPSSELNADEPIPEPPVESITPELAVTTAPGSTTQRGSHEGNVRYIRNTEFGLAALRITPKQAQQIQNQISIPPIDIHVDNYSPQSIAAHRTKELQRAPSPFIDPTHPASPVFPSIERGTTPVSQPEERGTTPVTQPHRPRPLRTESQPVLSSTPSSQREYTRPDVVTDLFTGLPRTDLPRNPITFAGAKKNANTTQNQDQHIQFTGVTPQQQQFSHPQQPNTGGTLNENASHPPRRATHGPHSKSQQAGSHQSHSQQTSDNTTSSDPQTSADESFHRSQRQTAFPTPSMAPGGEISTGGGPSSNGPPGNGPSDNEPTTRDTLQAIFALTRSMRDVVREQGEQRRETAQQIENIRQDQMNQANQENYTAGSSRWRTDEIGFFDPHYESMTGEDIITAGKDTVYRDVFLFTNQLRQIASIKGEEVVRLNSPLCLRGYAQQWFSSELTTEQQAEYRTTLERWIRALINRFQPDSGDAFNKIQTIKYTVQDAREGRHPAPFVQQINRAAKTLKMPQHTRLEWAWRALDPELQMDIDCPTEDTTVDKFIKQIESKRETWKGVYGRRQSRRSTTPPRDSGFSKFTPRQQDQVDRTSFIGRNPNRDYTRQQNWVGRWDQGRYPNNTAVQRINQIGQHVTPGQQVYPNQAARQPWQDPQQGMIQNTQPQYTGLNNQPWIPNQNFQYRSNPQYSQSNQNFQYRPNSQYTQPNTLHQAFQQWRGNFENQRGVQPNANAPNQPWQQRQTTGGRGNSNNNFEVRQRQIEGPPQQRMIAPANQANASYSAEANNTGKQSTTPDPNVDTGDTYAAFSAGYEAAHQNYTTQPQHDFMQDYVDSNMLALVERIDQLEGNIMSNYTTNDYSANGLDHQQQPENKPDQVDASFITAQPSKDFTCRNCNELFQSNNKLHRHIRSCDKKLARDPTLRRTEKVNYTQASPHEVPTTPHTPIIQSRANCDDTGGLGFRSWQYARIQVSFTPDTKQLYTICVDSGCRMSLMSRPLFMSCFPNIPVKHMRAPITVRGITGSHQTDEYVTIDMYIPAVLHDQPIKAQLHHDVHLVDSLAANILLGSDILGPERATIDYNTERLHLHRCQGAATPLEVMTRTNDAVRCRVLATNYTTIQPNCLAKIEVNFTSLPAERDYIFEPSDRTPYLGDEGGFFTHIIRPDDNKIFAFNATDRPVNVQSGLRLGTIVDYGDHGAYYGDIDLLPMAIQPSYTAAYTAETWDENQEYQSPQLHQPDENGVTPPLLRYYPPDIDNPHNREGKEHKFSDGMTIWGTDEDQDTIRRVAMRFPDVWQDKGETIKVDPDDYMRIPTKAGAHPRKQRVYPLSTPARRLVDEVFDKLHDQGKMRWSTTPTEHGYPVFVTYKTVYKDDVPQRIGRVVIDLRALNEIMEAENYPLPRHEDIISSMKDCKFISSVDATSYFYQFKVHHDDQHKCTIISHRGQEVLTVAPMGNKNSACYAQRQSDNILRDLRAFTRAFIDDFYVFSKTQTEHVKHLVQLFARLHEYNYSMAAKKAFLNFPSLPVLGQYVSSVGLTTLKEKLAAILDLEFPTTLAELEHYIGLTGWLRRWVEQYALKAEPLEMKKTALLQPIRSSDKNKGSARKAFARNTSYGEPTERELQSFEQLQHAFRIARMLIHYEELRRLYVDLDSSYRAIGAMVYHVKGDTLPPNIKKEDIQPILFLSRLLSPAEKRYWPTELEIAGLVWVVKQVHHMIQSNARPTVIITDHSAAIGIIKQTTLSSSSVDKVNLRLVRASQYLSQFSLDPYYKPGKEHIVPDALSRLPMKRKPKPNEVETDELNDFHVYHFSVLEMSQEFNGKIKQGLEKDKKWAKIIELIKKQQDLDKETQRKELKDREFAKILRFRLHEGLLYFVDPVDERHRLCIPESMEQEVFQMAHDQQLHGGLNRIYPRITSNFMVKNLKRRLRQYISHCPTCLTIQTKRHKPYGFLNPIDTPPSLFTHITMDFVSGLPEEKIGDYTADVFLTITDKFSKRVLIIPGSGKWNAKKWGTVLMRQLQYCDWGMPTMIVSDRDKLFTSQMWKGVFEQLNTHLAMSAAYHPQTDGQSERTNQTVEIAMRMFVADNPTTPWPDALPAVQHFLNNSANSTGSSATEIMYGNRVREAIDVDSHPKPSTKEASTAERMLHRNEAVQAIAFANTQAKMYYDKKHLPLLLKPGNKVYIKLHHGYSSPDHQGKLSARRVGPFTVKKSVGRLAYELDIPREFGKIHPVISVTHLEPAPDEADPWNRQHPEPGPVEMEGDTEELKSFDVERIVNKKVSKIGKNLRTSYRVKWEGYPDTRNEWYPVSELENCKELIDEYEQRERRKANRSGTPSQEDQDNNNNDQAVHGRRTEKGLPRKRGRPRKEPTTPPKASDDDQDQGSPTDNTIEEDSAKHTTPEAPGEELSRRRGRPRKAKK